MVRQTRGTENVSPSDALSPKARLSCPAGCKGQWRWVRIALLCGTAPGPGGTGSRQHQLGAGCARSKLG